MPIEIVIRDERIQQALEGLAQRTGHLRPAFANIGEYLLRSTKERFSAQKDPQGKPWAPLKRSTLVRKKNPKILTESRRLQESIAYHADDEQVTVGTNVVYAAIHQFGGRTSPHTIRPVRKRALFWPGASHPVRSVKHPGSQIPARPFLGVSDEDRQEVLDIISDHAMGRNR